MKYLHSQSTDLNFQTHVPLLISFNQLQLDAQYSIKSCQTNKIQQQFSLRTRIGNYLLNYHYNQQSECTSFCDDLVNIDEYFCTPVTHTYFFGIGTRFVIIFNLFRSFYFCEKTFHEKETLYCTVPQTNTAETHSVICLCQQRLQLLCWFKAETQNHRPKQQRTKPQNT